MADEIDKDPNEIYESLVAISRKGSIEMETPDMVYGRLTEAVHLSGYNFERACQQLEWLLADDKWKKVGKGFDDIDEFLSTICFGELRFSVEQRKKLVRKLADVRATQRTVGKLLGVDHATVSRDLKPKKKPLIQELPLKEKANAGANAPKTDSEPLEAEKQNTIVGANAPQEDSKLPETGEDENGFGANAPYRPFYIFVDDSAKKTWVVKEHHANCWCSDCYIKWMDEERWGCWHEGYILDHLYLASREPVEEWSIPMSAQYGDVTREEAEALERERKFFINNLAGEICSLINRYITDFGWSDEDGGGDESDLVPSALEVVERALDKSQRFYIVENLKDAILKFLSESKNASQEEIEEGIDYSMDNDEARKAVSQLIEQGCIKCIRSRTKGDRYIYIKGME